jgi:hypothetical protein
MGLRKDAPATSRQEPYTSYQTRQASSLQLDRCFRMAFGTRAPGAKGTPVTSGADMPRRTIQKTEGTRTQAGPRKEATLRRIKDYRKRKAELERKRFAKHSSDGFSIRADAYADPEFVTSPEVGDRWGQWRYEKDGRHWERRLIFAGRYGIAARYETAIEAFRTILHVSQKTWATSEVIGTMIQALTDINPNLESLAHDGKQTGTAKRKTTK